MARAQGARAQMALAYETVYGTPPLSGFRLMPFARTTLGSEQPLLESELLGYGRDPLAPLKDAVTADGEVVIFVDGQGVGQALDFFEGQEPVAGNLGPTAETEGRIVRPHLPEHGQIEHLAQHLARPVGAHRRGLRRSQLLAPLLGGFLLGWPGTTRSYLGQQAIDVGGRDVGDLAVLPLGQDQFFQHALLVRGVGRGQSLSQTGLGGGGNVTADLARGFGPFVDLLLTRGLERKKPRCIAGRMCLISL